MVKNCTNFLKFLKNINYYLFEFNTNNIIKKLILIFQAI